MEDASLPDVLRMLLAMLSDTADLRSILGAAATGPTGALCVSPLRAGGKQRGSGRPNAASKHTAGAAKDAKARFMWGER